MFTSAVSGGWKASACSRSWRLFLRIRRHSLAAFTHTQAPKDWRADNGRRGSRVNVADYPSLPRVWNPASRNSWAWFGWWRSGSGIAFAKCRYYSLLKLLSTNKPWRDWQQSDLPRPLDGQDGSGSLHDRIEVRDGDTPIPAEATELSRLKDGKLNDLLVFKMMRCVAYSALVINPIDMTMQTSSVCSVARRQKAKDADLIILPCHDRTAGHWTLAIYCQRLHVLYCYGSLQPNHTPPPQPKDSIVACVYQCLSRLLEDFKETTIKLDVMVGPLRQMKWHDSDRQCRPAHSRKMDAIAVCSRSKSPGQSALGSGHLLLSTGRPVSATGSVTSRKWMVWRLTKRRLNW